MRETRDTLEQTTRPAAVAVPLNAVRHARVTSDDDLSFDALMKDDLIRMVMASDRVSEGELEALRDVRPLIDEPR